MPAAENLGESVSTIYRASSCKKCNRVNESAAGRPRGQKERSMRATGIAFIRALDWPFLACLVVLIVLMAPMLKTDYLCDDNGNSLVHGILKYHHYSLPDLLIQDVTYWL